MKYKFIEEKATELLKSKGLYSLPVDVFELTNSLSIKLEQIETDDNVSGFFMTKGQNSIIGYNTKESYNRVRFTIAHEIGHMMLHAKFMPLFVDKKEGIKLNRDGDSRTGDIKMEREANAFAASLLMPAQLLEVELKGLDHLEGRNLISHLAHKFKVSVEAMAFRLTNLEMIDVGL